MRGVRLGVTTASGEISIYGVLPRGATKSYAFAALRSLLVDAGTLIDAHQKLDGGGTQKQWQKALPKRAISCAVTMEMDLPLADERAR